MKSAALIVLFAIVLASECAVVQIVPGLSYTAVQGPSWIGVAPPVDVASRERSYVAHTRGPLRVDPLPGHANSAASVNLEPAPGTA